MSVRPLPTYHLRPARGWINDPNGMVFHEGRWHVFYQHNPVGPVHDAIAWGHASTADLLTWRHHPVAFGPTPDGPDRFGCWSGVFVPGLERPAVVYSGVVGSGADSTVVLRWGSPDLETWGEPQVVAHTPEGAGIAVMRDPFVFTWAGRRWALVGAGAQDGTPRVLVYDCDDVTRWHYRGVFLDGSEPMLRAQAPAGIWECPQLVAPTASEPGVVVLSLWNDGVLGDAVGVTGDIVDAGGYPAFRAGGVQPLDAGDSFYAPQIALDPRGGDPLMFGWLREGDLAPETHEVAGCLSLPRRLAVRAGVIEVTPDAAVARLPVGPATRPGAGVHDLPAHCMLHATTGEAYLVGEEPLPGQAPVRHRLDAGARAFVDGQVAEVFAGRAVPASYRTGGAWRLDVGAGARVEVAEVTGAALSSPARSAPAGTGSAPGAPA